MVDWTDDRIAALSDKDLKTLLVNAERKSATEVIEKCQTALESRNAAKPRKGPKPRTEVKEFEHQIAGELAAVGTEMAAKYDLSEETAKAGAVGVKGFKAHKLLDAKGFAKLGGMQRDGSVAIERYISHRRGDGTVYLGVFLAKDAPIEDHEFQVIAPQAFLDGGQPVAQVRPSATEKQKQPADRALSFKDLPSAAAAFDAALAKITA
ncbi:MULTISPECIES: hypothetical protein [Rhodopseudomonas]|uniref:Uncharacterized protein n=1 Tax=Rhodopseudomonas palustris TaxID=1076 RepID=A0A0D7EGB4_RHOPL|nr:MULTISPECIES: hypothetical protein [Rhodopseudomonas]KIZ39570.1 hypothetical protein OO17_20075 [Rhodopseudomonas palustris]MDF3810438.1 hypothetical protein [Rhodopseudomonas sp. BAL398]WOK19582.1 hypothetical protein RBJ75_08725 [Rhodopseudomonas sp. BAL398]